MSTNSVFGIDFDVWNEQPVFKQIESIESNTKLTNESINKILEHLEKQQNVPLESVEPLQQKQSLEPLEEVSEEVIEENETTISEEQIEEVLEEVPEEVIEEDVTDEIDYLPLILEEMQLQTQNSLALSEQIEVIQAQNEISNNADHLISIYGMAVFPAMLIIFALNKLIRPFTSY